MKINRHITGGILLGFATLLESAGAHATTQVVTSLKPLELLVKAVATENVEVTTLVAAGSSPHNYTLRPSQREALESADVIFWVGPEMETFLTRLLSGGEFRNRTFSLMHGDDVPEIASDHHEDHHHGHDDHAHGDGEDPHIWLDPALAVSMARDIHRILAEQEGADVASLNTNLKAFEENVAKAEQAITQRLKPAGDIALFTYHNAFTRFIEHYGLKLEGILTLNPELSPGAKHVAEVQSKLRDANQPCLLTEPQFNRQWWRSITEGLDVTFSTWDPLATDIQSDRNGYVAFQHNLADSVLACLPQHTQ